MKTLIFSICLFIFSWQIQAQEYTLSGKVSRHGNPLIGATVTVKGTSIGTQTQTDGTYLLNLEKGKYTIVFSYGNQKEIPITLTENKVLNVDLSEESEALNAIVISSIRVDADSPITHSNMTADEVASRNLGQDIPVLMKYMPSVVTTTDAGAGVGYTSMRVRGSSAMNVTINGIPYNDSESQGTFWVNLSDIASSVESLQLQRGVGTSTNGAGAFGASLNMQTENYQSEAFATVANSYGSFNTHKHTVELGSGLIDEHWAFSGRLSRIASDGYIDRASSDLRSYFLQGVYIDENTLVKALTFGGKERTYQAWFGITKKKLESNRTYNPAGEYTDENGKEKYYENQTDNYQQDHFQLIWNQKYNAFWSSKVALHYTMGQGYYEEYEEDADLTYYDLKPFSTPNGNVTTSDLVDQSWLDNDFYGAVFSVNYKKGAVDALLGGGWNKYAGDHFGRVIYTRFAQNQDPFEPYYFNTGYKTDFNLYGKMTWKISSQLATYVDLQMRTIHYWTKGPLADDIELNIDDHFTFFNPKLGLTYQLNYQNQLYFSFARAHREPNRTDYENGNPVPEELNDFELGWRFGSNNFSLNTNLYYMRYKNQLVLTGAIDEEGSPIRKNSGKSYRLGIEVNAALQVTEKLSLHPTAAFSRNKNIDFVSKFNGKLVDFGDTKISFSPQIIASNSIRYAPIENFEISFLSKYVGEQYMSNIETEASKLGDYFVNDLNLKYTWKEAPVFNEIVFTGLVNNLFDVEYVSNGYYFSYETQDPSYPSGFKTIEGARYYPQAGINFLLGLTLKF